MGLSDEIVDQRIYSSGQVRKGNTYARNQGEVWQEAEPTPGVENVFASNTVQQVTQNQPEIFPVLPPSAVAGKEFSVGVTLSNFESGTYAIKVIIGKDGKFIYGNTKGGLGWLTQNGSWAEFPAIAVSASGTGSGTVQAKVDEEAPGGSYAIKVRVHKDGNNYDSPEQPLVVSSAPVSALSSPNVGEVDGEEPSALAAFPIGEGKALGAEAPQNKEFKLNFYVITGIFGLIVGSFGLFLGFRYRKNSSVAAR
uniref:Uncharacterized protein n=1 Tax=candidate division WWE3 bacterium TaxID=2053526 RepID=A0A831Z0D3_UNCKA